MTKPHNRFGAIWNGFTPQKQWGKLTLDVFQNKLSNPVNSESLQDFLSYSVLSGSLTDLILDVNDLAPVGRV